MNNDTQEGICQEFWDKLLFLKALLNKWSGLAPRRVCFVLVPVLKTMYMALPI